MTTELQQYVNDSPTVRAAVTEAVHRYYYDRVLDPRERKNLGEVGHVLGNLWNLQPDWRHVLKTSFERYEDAGPVVDVPLINKPKLVIPLPYFINIFRLQ